MSRRIGRWTYYSHPYNGPVWRLDGTTLDLEHDPHDHSVCIGGRCNGAWVLYRDGRYAEPVCEHLIGYGGAMWQVERMHDEERRASLTIEAITRDELAAHWPSLPSAPATGTPTSRTWRRAFSST